MGCKESDTTERLNWTELILGNTDLIKWKSLREGLSSPWGQRLFSVHFKEASHHESCRCKAMNSANNLNEFWSRFFSIQTSIWKYSAGTSLTVQWLTLPFNAGEIWFWSLVEKLRSYMPWGQKIKNETEANTNPRIRDFATVTAITGQPKDSPYASLLLTLWNSSRSSE